MTTDLRSADSDQTDRDPPVTPTDPSLVDLRDGRAWVIAALPVVLVALVVGLRNDVSVADLAIYTLYFCVCVVAPGTALFCLSAPHRALRSADKLVLGTVTGIVAGISALHLCRLAGFVHLARWWWLPVLVACIAIPSARSRVLQAAPHEQASPGISAWATSAISSLTLVLLDLTILRSSPLAPGDGNNHRDQWWHLAIVDELRRSGPATTPQVAGEPFGYHFNSHAHVAMGAETTGLPSDLVLFKLWLIPVAVVAILLIGVLAREITGTKWSGPVAAWLSVGALSGGYLWTDFGNLFSTPLRFASPSQMLGLLLAFSLAWMIIRWLRSPSVPAAGSMLWFAVTALIAGRAKPTVIPILFAATLLAIGAHLVVNRRLHRSATIAAGTLLLVQASAMLARDGAPTNITLLGSLKSLSVYSGIVQDETYRGVNDGLWLDSLSEPGAVLAAFLTVSWLVGSQLIRFAGTVVLTRREGRRDLVAWWLTGALLAGFIVFFMLDVSSFGQAYFLHISLPFGALLTTMLLAQATQGRAKIEAAVAVGVGLIAGSLIVVFSQSAAAAFAVAEDHRTVDRLLLPVAIAGAFGGLAFLTWRRARLAFTWLTGLGLAATIGLVVGLGVPGSIESTANAGARWIRTSEADIDPSAVAYVSPEQKEAAVWLRENSDTEDVVVTNSFCLPVTDVFAGCNAIGFWISGISGRRMVLEGWGYTPETHAAHGVDGKHRNRQPSPWPDRFDESREIIASPSSALSAQMQNEYDAKWLFGVQGAGEIADDFSDVGEVVFDNGAVVIVELRP